jgi:hypothetical protein
MSARPRARSTTKIGLKNNLYSHGHFTEHMVGAFGKPPRECNLNYKTSNFLIRQLKNKTGLHLQQSTQESENSKTVNGGGKCSQLSGFSTVLESASRERVKRPGASATRRGRCQARWTTGGSKTEIEASQSRPSLVLYTRSPTHITILVAACHVTPATCTP